MHRQKSLTLEQAFCSTFLNKKQSGSDEAGGKWLKIHSSNPAKNLHSSTRLFSRRNGSLIVGDRERGSHRSQAAAFLFLCSTSKFCLAIPSLGRGGKRRHSFQERREKARKVFFSVAPRNKKKIAVRPPLSLDLVKEFTAAHSTTCCMLCRVLDMLHL